MARRVVWAPAAATDLEQIVEFIARDSVHYGKQVARDVIDVLERAAIFPGTGRIVPELADPAIREQFVYSYRVVYRSTEDAIHVIAIVHGSRDFATVLGNRKT